MVFNSKEEMCSHEILNILSSGKNHYMIIFSKIHYSYTTFQRTINFLILNKLVKRTPIEHKNIDYEITKKGTKFLSILENLYGLIVLK